MIEIIGNIKIDPSDKVRLRYLLASIESFSFLKDQCLFQLHIDGAIGNSSAYDIISKALFKIGFKYILSTSVAQDYGNRYLQMINHNGRNIQPSYILNFHEDHFCILDDAHKMEELLQMMQATRADICRASFWEIETKCMEKLYGFHVEEGNGYSVWRNTKEDFQQFQSAYPGGRYYIGTNNIMHRDFAKKFWDRRILSRRPHEYEIQHFMPELIHNVMVPPFEITAAIDDDHGENNSCLLKRKEQKFWDIFNAIEV